MSPPMGSEGVGADAASPVPPPRADARKARSEPRIAIVGAGPVGATLALALARAALPSLLIDQRRHRSSEQRPVALSYSSRQIFDALGVWHLISPLASPIVHVHVSQRARFGATRLSAGEFGLDALGYVCDVGALVGVLNRVLAEASGVRRLSSSTVSGVERADRGLRLHLAGTPTESGTPGVDVDAVVAADGGQNDWCAEYVETTGVREYRQVALGALVRGEKDHGSVAYERFTPEGPMALLPMRGGVCALVWTLSPERGGHLQQASEGTFLAALHRAFGDRLGRFAEVKDRELVPLRRVRRRSRAGARIYLAGSAANTLHPVAGQGLNLGLRDAAVIAELFADLARKGLQAGAPESLARYHALRSRDHDRVNLATDLLARVFLSERRPLALLRGAALVGLDLASPAKRAFARYAMGLGLPASRMVRGLAP